MKLSENDRLKIETFAKEIAQRQYLRQHAGASELEAWGFALRVWRNPEFIEGAAEILAIGIALDEVAAAAPLN